MAHTEDHGGGAPIALSADDVLARIVALARGAGAIDLRIGELLAALRAMDLRLLGYSTYTAFLAEEVDVDGSWARQLARLARSRLDLVKVALCRGVLPVSVAVKAPGLVEAEGQLAWIEAFLDGNLELQRKRVRPLRVDLDDTNDVRLVHETRILARTVMGYPAPDEQVDQHILRAWTNRVDGAALVREASEPRDVPVLEPLHWDEDPAADVLGPRVVPLDEGHALGLLKEMLRLRRTRRLELGTLYHFVGERKLYRDLGFGSLKEMARQALPVTQRTLQDCQDQAAAVSFYPELEAALADGMDVGRLMAVYSIATEDNVGRWLAVARRTSLTELTRAVTWAGETTGGVVLDTYERAIRETKDAHSWVALRAARRPVRPPRTLHGVHPQLVEACGWYRDNVRLPRQSGFQRVKERERFTCESPLCNRTSLRCDAHHAVYRSHGGCDADWNARCVCKACHLRMVHTGMVQLETVQLETVQLETVQLEGSGAAGGPDVWTYATGRRVVVF